MNNDWLVRFKLRPNRFALILIFGWVGLACATVHLPMDLKSEAGTWQSAGANGECSFETQSFFGSPSQQVIAVNQDNPGETTILNERMNEGEPSTVPEFMAQIDGLELDDLSVFATDPTIEFTWSHATDSRGIDRYEVQLLQVGNGQVQAEEIDYPATSHRMRVKGLLLGERYRVVIRACNRAQSWGEYVSGGTLIVSDPALSVQVPNFVATINGRKVSGLLIKDTGPMVVYQWDHPRDPSMVDHYQILLKPTSGPWLYSQDVSYPTRIFALGTHKLEAGTSYSVHVRAKNRSGSWGAFSHGGVFTVEAANPPATVVNLERGMNGHFIEDQMAIDQTNTTINYIWNPLSEIRDMEHDPILVNAIAGPGNINREPTSPQVITSRPPWSN